MADDKKTEHAGDGARVIQNRHPDYATRTGIWQFFEQSYKGGRAYIDSNLFQYFKEGEDEFAGRKKRAYRENHSKRIVDLINSYLFKEEPVRKTENTRLKEFHKNVDGQGKSISKFMKTASQWASVFGRVYIMVDKRPVPEGEATGTAKDNLHPKAQPYAYMIFPYNVLDFAVDEQGRYKWALIREDNRDDDDPFASTLEVKTQYRLWYGREWILYDERGNEKDRGETGREYVPMVALDNEEEDKYGGQ